ncbi:MAG: N-formylglutamate amidohydrolase [Allosphingosinicella sp.]|uniref:N-formylglutamate amidohydrolase n=1 Tax=Allosphingosinicella sp. TaxID=2823234 RepID=UPI0039429C88
MPYADPVIFRRPAAGAELPIVYDSPHSGRSYPEDFRPVLPVEQLWGFEDRMVDDLLVDAPDHGVLLIAANFPRAYIDPNRAPDDIGEDLTGADWPHEARPTDYSRRGLGLIFRVGPDGKPIYERPLDHDDILRRIEKLWRPYHAALEEALAAAERRWGKVWHVNWHSMRPVGDALAPDPGATRPDFVVSDRDGTSAEAPFTDRVAGLLEELGYTVARNAPFKGGYITALHGRPAQGRHSVQIEINRRLYLDAATLEPTDRARALRRDLSTFTRTLAEWARARISGS